jgi:carbonic anhydrase
MKNNASFVKEFEPEKMSHMTQKLAIVTCMDTRLTGFLEPTRGIGRGDAKIIKNAGGVKLLGVGDFFRVLMSIFVF